MEGAKAFAANSRRDNRPAPGCAAVVSRSAFPSLRPDLPHSTKSSASSAAIVSGEPHTSGRKRSSSSLCSSAASADPRLIIHATSVEHFRCSPTPGVSRAGKRERSGRCTASAAHPCSAQCQERHGGCCGSTPIVSRLSPHSERLYLHRPPGGG